MSPQPAAIRILACAGMLLVCGACHHAASHSVQPAVAPPLTVRKVSQYRDSAQLKRNVGSIAVVARAVERPTESIHGFVVSRTDSSGKVLKDYVSEGDSAVTILELPVGWHYLAVKRLGFQSVRFKVSVDAGCRTDIEAYIRMDVMGLQAVTVTRDRNGKERAVVVPPSYIETSGRSTITACNIK